MTLPFISMCSQYEWIKIKNSSFRIQFVNIGRHIESYDLLLWRFLQIFSRYGILMYTVISFLFYFRKRYPKTECNKKNLNGMWYWRHLQTKNYFFGMRISLFVILGWEENYWKNFAEPSQKFLRERVWSIPLVSCFIHKLLEVSFDLKFQFLLQEEIYL